MNRSNWLLEKAVKNDSFTDLILETFRHKHWIIQFLWSGLGMSRTDLKERYCGRLSIYWLFQAQSFILRQLSCKCCAVGGSTHFQVSLLIWIERKRRSLYTCMMLENQCVLLYRVTHTFEFPCFAYLMPTFVTNHSEVIYLQFIFIFRHATL